MDKLMDLLAREEQIAVQQPVGINQLPPKVLPNPETEDLKTYHQ